MADKKIEVEVHGELYDILQGGVRIYKGVRDAVKDGEGWETDKDLPKVVGVVVGEVSGMLAGFQAAYNSVKENPARAGKTLFLAGCDLYDIITEPDPAAPANPVPAVKK